MRQTVLDIISFFGRLRNVLSRRDLVPKLFSLLLAVMLWAYIGSTRLSELDYRIPIEFKNQPAALVVAKQSLSSITIHLNGKKEDIANFNIKNVKAQVNLEGAREGENLRFPITLVRHEIPESIRVNISRKFMTLSLEKKVYRRVPVDVIMGENIREGLVLGPVSVRPETVLVEGRESLVKYIESVRTETFHPGFEAGKIERDVPIDLKDVLGLTISPGTVRIQAAIYEMENLQKIELPLSVRNLKEGFGMETARKNIKIYVKSNAKDIQFAADDFDAVLDFGKINYRGVEEKGEAVMHLRVTASLKSPREGVSVVMVSPALVQVTVKKK